MQDPDIGTVLAEAVVRQCGPTLLGAKPANMFTFRGGYASSCPCRDGDSAPAWECPLESGATRGRVALARAVCELDRLLAPAGVRCTVLAWRPFGALVYLWRPALLEEHLRDGRIRGDLFAAGYDAAGIAWGEGASEVGQRCLIGALRRRFRTCSVPHEVGFFLGYPYEDVRGFIDGAGGGFRCFGCWKVYGDARAAQYRFARFKRCARRAVRLYRAGMPLVDLAQAPVPALRAREPIG